MGVLFVHERNRVSDRETNVVHFILEICFHMMYNNFKDLVDILHIDIIIKVFYEEVDFYGK